MGLMAQDVLEYKPDAVGEVGGILGVDYKKALEDAIPQRAAGGVVPYGAVQRGAGIIPPLIFAPATLCRNRAVAEAGHPRRTSRLSRDRSAISRAASAMHSPAPRNCPAQRRRPQRAP